MFVQSIEIELLRLPNLLFKLANLLTDYGLHLQELKMKLN